MYYCHTFSLHICYKHRISATIFVLHRQFLLRTIKNKTIIFFCLHLLYLQPSPFPCVDWVPVWCLHFAWRISFHTCWSVCLLETNSLFLFVWEILYFSCIFEENCFCWVCNSALTRFFSQYFKNFTPFSSCMYDFLQAVYSTAYLSPYDYNVLFSSGSIKDFIFIFFSQ